MKEFREKLIKRLNEKAKWVTYGNRDRDIGMTHKVVPFSDISDIVNELAEEYNNGWIPCSECKGCKYENSTDIKIHLDKCTHCKRAYHSEEDRDIHEDLYNATTNADRIRNMSDEELADMLHNIGSYVEDGDPLIDIYIGENKSTIDDSFGFILDWLQREVEGSE